MQTVDLLSVTGLRAEEPRQIALSQSHKKQALMRDRLCRASNNTLIQSRDEVKRAAVAGLAFVIVMSEDFCDHLQCVVWRAAGLCWKLSSSYGMLSDRIGRVKCL